LRDAAPTIVEGNASGPLNGKEDSYLFARACICDPGFFSLPNRMLLPANSGEEIQTYRPLLVGSLRQHRQLKTCPFPPPFAQRSAPGR